MTTLRHLLGIELLLCLCALILHDRDGQTVFWEHLVVLNMVSAVILLAFWLLWT